jgi:hypothetical protein
VLQVIGISFIDKSTEPKAEWLEYLSKLRNQVQIIILPTPTGLTNNKQQVQVLHPMCIRRATLACEAMPALPQSASLEAKALPQRLSSETPSQW